MNIDERQRWLAKHDFHPEDLVLVSLPGDYERQFFSCSPASFLLYTDELKPRALVRMSSSGVCTFVEPRQ